MAYIQPSGELNRVGYNESVPKTEGGDPIKKGITKTTDKGWVANPYEKTQEVETIKGKPTATLFKTGAGDVYQKTKIGSKEDVEAKKKFTADSTYTMNARNYNAGQMNINDAASKALNIKSGK